MPHVTLESTANVEIDTQLFFEELCEKMVATGNAPKLGMKCRHIVSEDYYIVDGNKDYKMVNLLLRLREGRSDDVLSEFSRIAMDLMEKHFQKDIEAKTIILSTEIKELIKGIDLTKNAIR